MEITSSKAKPQGVTSVQCSSPGLQAVWPKGVSAHRLEASRTIHGFNYTGEWKLTPLWPATSRLGSKVGGAGSMHRRSHKNGYWFRNSDGRQIARKIVVHEPSVS